MMLSNPERRVLKTFRQFMMNPGQMLCFYGANLKASQAALDQLTEREFLIKEQFKGGYSLTREGFVAMKRCG
jgi:hypothetical protein